MNYRYLIKQWLTEKHLKNLYEGGTDVHWDAKTDSSFSALVVQCLDNAHASESC